MAKSKGERTQPCPECHGRGAIPWATNAVECSTCKGKGTVVVHKSASKDRG